MTDGLKLGSVILQCFFLFVRCWLLFQRQGFRNQETSTYSLSLDMLHPEIVFPSFTTRLMTNNYMIPGSPWLRGLVAGPGPTPCTGVVLDSKHTHFCTQSLPGTSQGVSGLDPKLPNCRTAPNTSGQEIPNQLNQALKRRSARQT